MLLEHINQKSFTLLQLSTQESLLIPLSLINSIFNCLLTWVLIKFYYESSLGMKSSITLLLKMPISDIKS